MTSSLFRKEALEHRKDRLYGDVILLQPLSLTVLVGVVALICAMILAILFWGTYARKETVRGYLVPDKGIVKISAPQPGIVSSVDVREGDEVAEGQLLVAILSERLVKGGMDIDALKLQEIEITKQQQLERIKGEQSLLLSDTGRLKDQIISIKKELSQLQESLKNQQDRLSILESRVAGAKKLLENKNISETEYQRYYDELLAQKQQYQDLLRTKVNRESTLTQTEAELQQLPIKKKALIAEIENSISELKQRYAEVEGHRTVELRSPLAGTVTTLQAREGQWISANMPNVPLMAILPKNAIMQAELFVPSRAIGFITPKQTVRIRYDAFPYRRFGIYEGKVMSISKHVLLPNELSVPIDSKEPVYRITVDLAQQNVFAYGQAFSLQAGMSLEADIILEKQTLFEWILDPLTSLRGRF